MQELPKAYDPKLVDPKWYQFWLDLGIFTADSSSEKPAYCIVIPPPNVTGVLHMGHALVNTLQDVLVRWKRMSGFEVLWVPGTDHAGIATQTVVERHLIKTQGKRRVDFQREEFLEHVWSWKEENENTILGQLKKIGSSCDWSRLRFTMDEGNNRAVNTMFKKLYDEGLIYRGDYLVNWDPITETALADDEVEYEDKNGFLWHFKFPLHEQEGHVTIATTRPETMLGDTAVAVSPRDARYKHLIGKFVMHPLRNTPIPIIGDTFVDPEFGTGALKITPAHDPNDYKIGLDHKLEFINIMTPNGKINENGGIYQGMTFDEARSAVVEAMKTLGLLEKIEPHANRVGISYRSKAVIEPCLSKQWFVKMEGFGKSLRSLVDDKKVKLIPENWNNTYFHWIDNLRDWCISRQLWWGHRIPIWYNKKDPSKILCSANGTPAEVQHSPDDWEQDADVLDTWFSSALWPFATLGWPDKTPELEKFYPNATLVTGHDILFFWVARMLAMGTYALGEAPFPETFLHGLIYGKSYWRTTKDGVVYVSQEERIAYDLGKPMPADVQFKWEKMSKSKGNVIDPLEIIEDYGTDAMRMTLCASASQAREIDLDRRRFEDFRNFTNKVWNGARFVLMNLADETSPLLTSEFEEGLDLANLALEDQWILSKLNSTIQDVNIRLIRYEFDQAANLAYDFFWKEFCAYYVEIAKPYLFNKTGTPQERKTKQKLLLILLTQAIKLLHPMAPFITEELFQILKGQFSNLKDSNRDPLTHECIESLTCPSIAVAPYPKTLPLLFNTKKAEEDFKILEEVIYTIRNIRGEMKLPPHLATDISIIAPEHNANLALVQSNAHILKALTKIRTLSFHSQDPDLPFSSTALFKGIKIMIPLPEELLQAEKTRLQKDLEKMHLNIARMTTQLENPEFTARAPEALITKQKATLAHEIAARDEITQKLQQFE
jgi:valyl-tRNA synthetase